MANGFGNIVRGRGLQVTPVRSVNITRGRRAPVPRIRSRRGASAPKERDRPDNVAANRQLNAVEQEGLRTEAMRGAVQQQRQANAAAGTERMLRLVQMSRGGTPEQQQERLGNMAIADQEDKQRFKDRFKAASEFAFNVRDREPDKFGRLKIDNNDLPLLMKMNPSFQPQFDTTGKLRPIYGQLESSGEPGSQQQVLAFYFEGVGDGPPEAVQTRSGSPMRTNLEALGQMAAIYDENQRRVSWMSGDRKRGQAQQGGFAARIKAINEDINATNTLRLEAYKTMNDMLQFDPEGADPATLAAARRFSDLDRQYQSLSEARGALAGRQDAGGFSQPQAGGFSQPQAGVPFENLRGAGGFSQPQAGVPFENLRRAGGDMAVPRPRTTLPGAEEKARDEIASEIRNYLLMGGPVRGFMDYVGR